MVKEKKSQNDVLCPSVCPSVFKTVQAVKAQIEYDNFFNERMRGVDPLYDELCLIVAEVYVMNPNSILKVAGSEMNAGIVREIYERLEHDHVGLVYKNFREVTSRVYNKKAYLRTALYNAVFEIESHYTNLLKHDNGF